MPIDRFAQKLPEYQTISGNDVTLRVNVDVLRALYVLVRQANQSSAAEARGAGGLLVGTREPALRLDALQLVAMEHSFGPPNELSGSDIEMFRRSIGRVSSSGVSVLGHFRIHPTGKPEITAADRTIAGLTGAAQPLMFLIQAAAPQPGEARLYRAAGNECAEVLQFRLSAPITPGLPAPAPEPALPQTAAAAGDRVTGRREPSFWNLWAILTIGAFAGTALAATLWFRQIHPLPAIKPLGLSVHQTGKLLSVDWNWSSPIVQDAVSGVLTINDGNRVHRIELQTKELRSERIIYAPQTGTVEVRLEVQRDPYRSSAESVTIVTGLPEPLPTPVAKIEPDNPATPARNAPSQRPKTALVASGRSPSVRLGAREASKPGATRTLTLPPVALPEAPRLSSGDQVVQTPPVTSLPEPPLPPSAPTSPPAVVRARPAVVAAAISYVAPVPLRKVSPAVPPNLRSMIQDDVSVELKVVINDEGKVVSATPVSTSNSGQKLLTSRAVQAALLWRFEPARRDGRPVTSDTVLKFDFARQSR